MPGRRSFSLATAVFAVLLVCSAANAAPKDAAGRRAGERAMNDLFAAAKYDDAKDALQSALSECSGCSKKTLASLHADLGIVLITGFNESKSGRAEMAKARSLDPSIALDSALVTPEVQAAFDAASTRSAAVEQDVTLEDEGDDEDSAPRRKKPPDEDEDEPDEPRCTTDADCDGRYVCRSGKCEPPQPPTASSSSPAVWIAIGLIQDLAIVSGSDVCSQRSQVSGGFTCLRASGSQYHGTPQPGAGGDAGGLALATTRVTLASYFRIWEPVSIGMRLGYAALGQGPQPDGGKSFLWLQAEAQGAYWLSKQAFSTKVVGTFLQVSGGVAEIDGKSKVTVREDLTVPPPPNQLDIKSSPQHSLDAYRKSGSGFAAVGAGLFIPLGSSGGIIADLRLIQLFPSSGTAISLGVSGALGL